MSGEEETRKLLKFREDLEKRLQKLEQEKEDIRSAITVIDSQIVRQGFKKATLPNKAEGPQSIKTDQTSLKSKSGVTLGTIITNEDFIEFTPIIGLTFTISTPPFQSFMIDRVLENMKKTDEELALTGEKPASEVLSYNLDVEGGRIIKIRINKYGGERRRREIQSSLRWVFDKMYDKLSEG